MSISLPGGAPLLILVGPTGAGKTVTAIELCHLLGGEIISADSMQIYRGCDIATAKVTPAERAAAPHHLIDICDPRETYSAARWAQDAQDAMRGITARGKVPIIAGGTGFYIQALLHPETLAPAPPDPALRATLEAEMQQHGPLWLHEKLQSLDPAAAARLHPNDLPRVMRAIEVAVSEQEAEGSGQKAGVSSLGKMETANYNALVFGLTMPRDKLYARLNARVDAMLATGALDELRHLIESGVPREAPALQGVGYRQLMAALDDAMKLPDAVELWKRDTRRYAKRQMTWFRHQLPTQWLDIEEFASPRGVAEYIVQVWRQTG